MSYVTRSGSEFRLDGRRFRFVGVNMFPLFVSTVTQAGIQARFTACRNRSITVVRTGCFDAGDPPTNGVGNFRYLSGGVLNWREASFVQLDLILDEARKKGIKLVLSLADNPTFDTKKTYVGWANSIHDAGLDDEFPYKGFFESEFCKDFYKEFVDKLVNRVNTINGRTYREDDSIFSWELGNELRVDDFEGGNVNTINSENLALLSKENGWIDEMSTYIKSVDPNHLVSMGGMSHTWQFVTGDTVSNGTFYGVDYNIISALPNIDYLDFHFYPTQGGGEAQILKYGQRLGYPNAVQRLGLLAQIKDYVAVGKANGKPVVCGEVGFVREVIASNSIFPLYPRYDAFSEIFKYFFEAGGDGVLLWHGETGDGGSYSINLTGWNGVTTNLNYNDIPLANMINEKNATTNGKRILVI